MDLVTDKERVDTIVAMAFGASVQPLTRITASTSKTITAKVGVSTRLFKNELKPTVITSLFLKILLIHHLYSTSIKEKTIKKMV